MPDWPAFGYDARNTGYVRDDTAPPDALTRLWSYETAFRNAGPAAISTDYVFHVIGQRVYAFDRLDGTIKWKSTVGTWGGEPPILVDGTLYIGWSGGVRAVDAASGDIDWTFDLSGGVATSPAYVTGTLIVGRAVGHGAGAVIGLQNGEEAWRYETPTAVSGPTVHDGTAYLGTRAELRVAGDSEEDVANRQAVLAVATDDGSEEWVFSGVNDLVSEPAVTEDRVYVSSADDHLYAINATTGDREWVTDVPLSQLSPPVVVEGVVYVGSLDGHVYAFDADSGDTAYRVQVGAPIERGISVVDEVTEEAPDEGWRQLIYAGSSDGSVTVVKTESEEVLSSVDLGAAVEGPPFVRDRLVHVATDDGNVHVLGR